MKVCLFCSGGFSTSLLASKMKESYAKRGMNDVEVEAYDFGSLDSVIDETDVVLLGPQIGWAKSQVEEDYPGKNVILMTIKEFGSMNGDLIVDRIEEELKK